VTTLRIVPTGTSELLAAALHYAASGWRVFPVHTVRNDCCTCGDSSCPRPAKHPLTHHGLHDASTDESKIRQWWHQWPDANIGVCAEDIGVVMDIDPRNGGDVSLERLIVEYGVLPETVEVMTGGGGTHYYFRSPVRLSKGGIEGYPGIDVQAAGSYVIAPPSLHRSGRRYEFEASSDYTLGQPVGECPAWLFKLRGEAAPMRTRSRVPLPDLSPAVPEILHEVIDALTAIDPDIGHDDWVKVGMAIHSQLWTEGFEIYDQWSSRARKYKGRQRTLRKWNTFNADGNMQGAQVGLPTLFYLAKQAGWQRAGAQSQSFVPPPEGESMIAMIGDITQTLRAPRWLVRKYLEAETLGVLFGEPGAGKSFIALDLGLSIATGRQWHGHKTKQTPVIYICGEGFAGLQRRAWAWKDWHEVDLCGVPFALTKRAVPLINARAVQTLQADIDRVVDQLGDAPGLFIVDTLARNFGGADENSTKDMGSFIEHVTQQLMERYKAGALLIHHTGHGDKQRARGSSSLKGAVDAEYCVTRQADGLVEFAGLKMKDAPEPEALHFSMRVVDLPLRDEEGETVTSVVPVAVSTAPVPPMVAGRRGSGEVQRACFDLLVQMMAARRANLAQGGQDPLRARVSIKEWQQSAIEKGLVADRKRFFDRRETLEAAGLIRTENGFAFIVHEGAAGE
jgi:hypothetical protein